MKIEEETKEKIIDLNDEKLLIDGRHAEKKKLEKQKEILSVQNKLRNLVIPEKPIVPNEPTKPVEPILRAEPTMSFEEKIVKDDVLEVFKEHMA